MNWLNPFPHHPVHQLGSHFPLRFARFNHGRRSLDTKGQHTTQSADTDAFSVRKLTANAVDGCSQARAIIKPHVQRNLLACHQICQHRLGPIGERKFFEKESEPKKLFLKKSCRLSGVANDHPMRRRQIRKNRMSPELQSGGEVGRGCDPRQMFRPTQDHSV